ncbi:UDP-glycosyltransferase [Flavobacterium urocaniciphilum]|uniref:UDP-glycosyltransferase n=1 Tax=Flavobacterium urocaniciphilum TaxID=1299341 RepID=A0A1H8YRS7_9FLAO|nr:UDP-glycosyltransferase [Flavobacterium urocaniciphilum]SEP54925.1 hypothetical protein SAMN05444005_10191 [Flavobacterium urocaniciphilum]
MNKKKIFILLPDGVGLRNFAFSNFHKIGKENFDIVFWNNTPFNLTDLNFSEVKIVNSKVHIVSDVIKSAINQSTLLLNKKIENDSIYDSYRFKPNTNGFKNKLKNFLVTVLIKVCTNKHGISFLRKCLNKLEKNTPYYNSCKEQLILHKPDFVFCTNQRHLSALAPLLAAKELKVPTATFIFSWDNLPKATMVVETDFYFVWSVFMKNELLKYYPNLKEEQVKITGTPQFETHFEEENYMSKEEFFSTYKLDETKKYICYSGDDITTCPDDEKYLEDVSLAVANLNSKGYNLGVIFRKSPVDFSNRYNDVLEKFKDIIVPIDPKWAMMGNAWNTVLPLKEDNSVLVNTIRFSEIVINLGSSMVFDFTIFEKPCLYINYDVTDKKQKAWSVNTIYKFVHFRSMFSKNDVIWLNNQSEIEQKIQLALENNASVEGAKKWFERINIQPANMASQRIWKEINTILNHG